MTNEEAPLKIAFVTGCPRSGTSILGELIGSHPDVEYRHEAHHVWRKAGLGEGESHRLTAEHATPNVRRAIRKRFQPKDGGPALVVEKNPRSTLRIPFLREVFPEAKIVHIVRDGRDVACSLMPGIGGEEWRHSKPPNWQALFREERGIVRCAQLWQAVVEIALADLEHVPHYSLTYEDLVRDPQRTARELVRYLELPEDRAVFEFCERIRDETAGSYQPEKQKKWYRDDHSVRIGRWRENLADDEARAVEALLRPLLTRLGYETAAAMTRTG